MAARNNDFTNIYRDARTDFAIRGVAILGGALQRVATIDPQLRAELDAALVDLKEAADWGGRSGQPQDFEAIRALMATNI